MVDGKETQSGIRKSKVGRASVTIWHFTAKEAKEIPRKVFWHRNQTSSAAAVACGACILGKGFD